MWLGLGAQFNKPYYYKYPTSIEGCNFTNLNTTGGWQNLTTSSFTQTLGPTTQSVAELKAAR